MMDIRINEKKTDNDFFITRDAIFNELLIKICPLEYTILIRIKI